MQKYEYNSSHLGKRVYVNTVPNWLTNAVRLGQCKLKPPMTGKIVGSSIGEYKIAVEFDQPIWLTQAAEVYVKGQHFTTNANGRGKPGHCAYFMPIHVQLFENNPSKVDTFVPCTSNRLLLLLIN